MPTRTILLALALALSLLLVSCGGLQPATPFPSQTPTLTLTPTATIVWFPPTETPTPRPTVEVTPTPDPRDLTGDLILQDDFSNESDWSLATTANSSAAIANNHLTLVLSKPRGYLLTTRRTPYLSNFYAEVSADVNLCRSQDEYGLILRAASSSDYYRLVLACDGTARVERLLRGVLSLPVPPVVNGAVPSGAPSFSRITVWAQGEDVRFYINEQYLFSLRDRALGGGSIGFFVRTREDSVVSVNFSELDVYQVNP